MLFNSISFALFFIIVFSLYWLIPHQLRWILLLVSSYFFYMCWNPGFIILIISQTLVSYVSALIIDKYKQSASVCVCALSVCMFYCLGMLFVYKYYNFFTSSIAAVLDHFSFRLNMPSSKLLLPVGISFYTFQTLGYVIDVYNEKVNAERHFGIFATFISFFPQLVAGPIERTANLLPQIKENHIFDYEQATYSVKLMVWGYFKKIVIADTIAIYIEKVFETPYSFDGFSLMLAAFLFSFEIYCDFSGYTDIAIGVAGLLGIKLSTNFKSPYFSQSITEFWSRWHISLSTWFRDYVYIPLGGNRVSKWRNRINLMITFLASGLWHGANWTFVVWGWVHGMSVIFEKWIFAKKKPRKTICSFPRVLIVFVFCTFAWVFFASNSVNDACYILSHMLDGISNLTQFISTGFHELELVGNRRAGLMVSLGILIIYDAFSLKTDCIKAISRWNPVARNIVYICMLSIIICFKASRPVEFVYFQF